MLNQLSIHNFAIVENLQIEFAPGMTAITGETGAGKSIIVGALGLALGDRADKDSIASGAEKADISAHFDLHDLGDAASWLAENELLSPIETNSCLLRRVVMADGRSKSWVNGCPVTLQQLKSVGEMLIDIHSQHEHQSLLKKATHLRLLDEYAGLQTPVQQIRQLFRQWKDIQQELESLGSQSEAQRAQHDLLRYQLQELQALGLREGELAALDSEYLRLNNADSTLATARQLLDLCSENEEHNLRDGINQARTILQNLASLPPSLASTVELLNSAAIQIEEAVHELNRNIDSFEVNPQRLEEINQRLADIQAIARKHRIRPEVLEEKLLELQQQLQNVSNSDERLASLKEAQAQALNEYRQLATQLSGLRRKAALELAEGINLQLKELGMASATLQIEITVPVPPEPTAYGMDNVEFLVSTNPGQPPKPLIKIASGGELSRISLAIQVVTAKTSVIPTLVFDEVDVGIGGGVAKAVGSMLRELGEHGQVISVTHQALVASQAHQHLFVSKAPGRNSRGQEQVNTRIQLLDGKERVQEIARMLGGEVELGLSPEALAHAQELVR